MKKCHNDLSVVDLFFLMLTAIARKRFRSALSPTNRRTWHFSDVQDELIPVGRVDRHGNPHRLSVTVVCRPGYLVHRDTAVGSQFEEVRLVRIRRTYGDPVAITDLTDAKCLGQVLYGALID